VAELERLVGQLKLRFRRGPNATPLYWGPRSELGTRYTVLGGR
jgi:hypothetical protein